MSDSTTPDSLAPIRHFVHTHHRGRALSEIVRANRARRAGVTLGKAMREARKRGGKEQ